MNRREAIFSLSSVVASLAVLPEARSREMYNVPLETQTSSDHLPQPAWNNGFRVLTREIDRKNITAIFDRFIPADALGPSASEAGCVEFLDNELAGDFGSGAALYLAGPLDQKNEKHMMGSPQFLTAPRERYLSGLAALEKWAQQHFNASFYHLNSAQIDHFLSEMEAGRIDLGANIDSKSLFELMLQNAREGYLADPIYGGNKNMAGWKMIGFPGARYDYRPYVDRHNENLNLIPVSLIPSD